MARPPFPLTVTPDGSFADAALNQPAVGLGLANMQVTPPLTPHSSKEEMAGVAHDQLRQQQLFSLHQQQQQHQRQKHHHNHHGHHYSSSSRHNHAADDDVFHNYIRAFYPFQPNDAVSSSTVTLPLEQGDIILVHSIHTNGWADGTVLDTGARGWLPTNYCEAYDLLPMRPLLRALTDFWDVIRGGCESNLQQFRNQDYMRGLIAGVRYLLEQSECLTRQAPLVQTVDGLRRTRKAVLSDLSTLVKIAKHLQDVALGTVDAPAESVDHLLDEMLYKAFRVVTRGVKFLDVWNEEVGLTRAIADMTNTVTGGYQRPPTPPADASFSPSKQSAASFASVGSANSIAPHASHFSHPVAGSPSDTSSFATTITTESSSHHQQHPPVSLPKLVAPVNGPTRPSVSHRISYNSRSAAARNPHFASERLGAAYDGFLGVLGAFIGLHLQSRSSTELILTTQQSVQSCRALLAVIEAIWEHDLHRSDMLEASKDGLYERITELVHAARDAFHPLRPGESAADDELVFMPDEGRRIVGAATDCVRGAGDCVAKARHVLEHVGDFELDTAIGPCGTSGVAADTSSGASDSAAAVEHDGPSPPVERSDAEPVDGDNQSVAEQQSHYEDANSQLQPVGSDNLHQQQQHDANVVAADGNQQPQAAVPDVAEPPAAADSAPSSSRTATSERDPRQLLPPISIPIESKQSLRSPPEEPNTVFLQTPISATTDESMSAVTNFFSLPDGSQTTMSDATADYNVDDNDLTIADPPSRERAGSSPSQPCVPPADINKPLPTGAAPSAPAGPSHHPSQSRSGSASPADSSDDTGENLLSKTYAHELMFKDCQIIGATLPALVEKLTTHESTPDAVCVSTVYLTFRQFTDPLTFARELVHRYEYVGEMPTIASPVRLRVYNFFKGWLESHWRHDCDDIALPEILKFARSQLILALPTAGKRLIDLCNLVSTSQGPLVPRLVSSIGKTNTSMAQYVSPDLPMPPPIVSRSQLNLLRQWHQTGHSPSILDFDPLELARQITLKVSSIFCAILPEELLGTEWMKKSGSLAVNVRAMSTLSTDIANLVADTILQLEEPKKRAAVIKQWVKIAAKCLQLNNYDTLMAIVCSLNSSTISRMRRTWELVSQKTKASFDSLRKIVDVSRNYAVLRQRLQNHVPPCLPFVGTYLTDLTFVDHGNPNTRCLETVGGPIEVINFDKHMKTAKIISELQRFQIPYRFHEICEMQTWIQDHLVRVRDAGDTGFQAYYRRSCYLEPRSRQPPVDTTLPSAPSPSPAYLLEQAKDKFDFLAFGRSNRSPQTEHPPRIN